MESEIKTEVIGPERALQILDNAKPNRAVNSRWIDRYAHMMRTGHFSESLLRFSEGRLVNGQHRLFAVMISGVPCRFIMVEVGPNWDETKADGYAQTLSHKMSRRLGFYVSPATAKAIKLAEDVGMQNIDHAECGRTSRIAKRVKGGGASLAVALLGRKSIDDLERRLSDDAEGGGIGVLVKWLAANVKRPSERESRINYRLISGALDDFARGKPVSLATLTKRRRKLEEMCFFR